ncbi:hypothetical protein Tco_1025090, partial [Tanacetum coccineum]
SYPTLFSVKLNHAGHFSRSPGREYLSGKVDFVDLLDSESFYVHEIHEIIFKLKYNKNAIMFYHFMIPEIDLDYGLLALGNALDVFNMIYVKKHKIIDLSIDHGTTTLDTYFVSSTKRSSVVIEDLDELEVPSPRKHKNDVNFFGLPNCRRHLTKK